MLSLPSDFNYFSVFTYKSTFYTLNTYCSNVEEFEDENVFDLKKNRNIPKTYYNFFIQICYIFLNEF